MTLAASRATSSATTVVAEAEAQVEADAGLVTRGLAFAADVVVIDVLGWLAAGLLALIASLFDLPDTVTKILVGAAALAGLIWAVGYFAFFWSTTGQTPGNRLMHIRVRRADRDAPLTIPHSVLRFAGMVLSALILFLGFAWILVDRRRRGLHDHIAGSIVVYVPDERERSA